MERPKCGDCVFFKTTVAGDKPFGFGINDNGVLTIAGYCGALNSRLLDIKTAELRCDKPKRTFQPKP